MYITLLARLFDILAVARDFFKVALYIPLVVLLLLYIVCYCSRYVVR